MRRPRSYPRAATCMRTPRIAPSSSRRSPSARSSRPSMAEKPIQLKVNGKPIVATVEPRLTLADFLRERLNLTGTHIGCEHGVCGACTILVADAEGPLQAIRACLMFAVQA